MMKEGKASDTVDYSNIFEASFKKELVQLEQMVSLEIFKNAKCELDVINRGIIIRLQSFVATQKLQTTHEIRFDFPRNWFQHLRQSLGLKYKTKYVFKKVIFEEKFLFPDMPFPPEGKFRYVKQNSIPPAR